MIKNIITYILIVGIIIVLIIQIKQFIQRRYLAKLNFEHYQCSGNDFILICKEMVYHHSTGKKIALPLKKLKKIRINHKIIYLATDKISTVFCPKYGVEKVAGEILRFSPRHIEVYIEEGLDISRAERADPTSPASISI